jgi:hypothetical protein
VPIHSGETIGVGLMAAILRDVQMSSEEFLKLLYRQDSDAPRILMRPAISAGAIRQISLDNRPQHRTILRKGSSLPFIPLGETGEKGGFGQVNFFAGLVEREEGGAIDLGKFLLLAGARGPLHLKGIAF